MNLLLYSFLHPAVTFPVWGSRTSLSARVSKLHLRGQTKFHTPKNKW